MLEVLNRKIRQMHAALEGLRSDDISSIQPKITMVDGCLYTEVDFNQHSDEIALANATSLLIANIASIKDHLKAWCRNQGEPFHGDKLIDSNKAVALIHDLWNIDKHAELKLPTRSGYKPRLKNIQTVLSISTGTAAGGGAFWSMDPITGKVTTGTSGGGKVQLTLSAQIIDEAGNVLGDFVQTCTDAADAWLSALAAAKVPLP
jgi:hypothetical protein